jgi:hypothetical protein
MSINPQAAAQFSRAATEQGKLTNAGSKIKLATIVLG